MKIIIIILIVIPLALYSQIDGEKNAGIEKHISTLMISQNLTDTYFS